VDVDLDDPLSGYGGIGFTMETIRVVLDSKLLRAAEAAARRAQLSRSALIREALRAHLKRLEIQERERRDRQGYADGPRDSGELSG
jgi:hypothetical protein